MVPHVVFLVFLESSPWIGVEHLGLRLFGAMVWKPLTTEPFFEWKLNKIKIQNYIGDVLGVVEKPLVSKI